MSKYNSASGTTGELKSRLIFVVIAILVFRLGVYIPIPNIDPTKLVEIISNQHSSTSGLMSMFNMFSGGALTQMSIFALGVMPYISASIIFQMLSAVYPKFIELKKKANLVKRNNSIYKILNSCFGYSTIIWYCCVCIASRWFGYYKQYGIILFNYYCFSNYR